MAPHTPSEHYPHLNAQERRYFYGNPYDRAYRQQQQTKRDDYFNPTRMTPDYRGYAAPNPTWRDELRERRNAYAMEMGRPDLVAPAPRPRSVSRGRAVNAQQDSGSQSRRSSLSRQSRRDTAPEESRGRSRSRGRLYDRETESSSSHDRSRSHSRMRSTSRPSQSTRSSSRPGSSFHMRSNSRPRPSSRTSSRPSSGARIPPTQADLDAFRDYGIEPVSRSFNQTPALQPFYNDTRSAAPMYAPAPGYPPQLARQGSGHRASSRPRSSASDRSRFGVPLATNANSRIRSGQYSMADVERWTSGRGY